MRFVIDAPGILVKTGNHDQPDRPTAIYEGYCQHYSLESALVGQVGSTLKVKKNFVSKFHKSFSTDSFCGIIALALIFVTLSCLQSCGRYKPYEPHPELIGYTETGIASFYSLKFQFRRTASGERFNNLGMTAAHKTLPLGTKVRVTNIKNGKSAIVTINDRGPFIKGRIIDLTRAAFSKIGSLKNGIAKVKIEVIK